MSSHASISPIVGASAIVCALSLLSLGSPVRAEMSLPERVPEASDRLSDGASGARSIFDRVLPPGYETPESRGKQSQECIWLGVDC